MVRILTAQLKLLAVIQHVYINMLLGSNVLIRAKKNNYQYTLVLTVCSCVGAVKESKDLVFQ
jgi:hypothetical protein